MVLKNPLFSLFFRLFVPDKGGEREVEGLRKKARYSKTHPIYLNVWQKHQ